MSVPTSKDELLLLVKSTYDKLFKTINTIPRWQQAQSFKLEGRDKSIRDVLILLYEWHMLMNNWYVIGMGGEKPKIPAEGYTWKTKNDLEDYFWKKDQDIPFELALNLFNDSHKRMIDLINNHTDKELYTVSFYKWTGNQNLTYYFNIVTVSNYEKATKKAKEIAKIALSIR